MKAKKFIQNYGNLKNLYTFLLIFTYIHFNNIHLYTTFHDFYFHSAKVVLTNKQIIKQNSIK